ncbi:hypothetical protein POPTR_003G016275v4 [Populus trichocarpa]|uniref:Uncharacterized protein n=1 Tax=Populus trichocarpa TaxID=3694 RepID=A0ACC0T767_POPTR|nr:hypothetical protein POPTR_003G016275v4 [Populus trichocarpa]
MRLGALMILNYRKRPSNFIRICSALRVICSRNVLRRIKHDISELSPMKFASSLGKYLRFPLIQGRVKRPDFNFIIDRIQSRLVDWKTKVA